MRLVFKLIVWFHTLLFLVLFFISDQDSSTSVNIHDTYYVISKSHLYFLFCILFLVYGIVDFITKNSRFLLYKTSSTLTISLVWSFIFVDYLDKKTLSEVDFNPLLNQPDYNFYLLIVLFILFITQVLFFINIFAVLILKLTRLLSRNDYE
jgi:hypothetical protein